MKKDTLANLLLEWYEQNGRDLPWRVKGGAHPDPYVILVSELMLQQTTVKTVIPYFYRFMEKFPTVNALAAAPLEEVYLYWQGLGYYSRARSLHNTAQIIMQQYRGKFPQTQNEVLKLKGIGPYTAASFLALAFNQPETVVDGNVIRIICRLYNLEQPPAEIMPLIRQKAEALTDEYHAADYASAIMDLGALICTPANPRCKDCPWQNRCQARQLGNAEKLPLRNKIAKPEKYGKVYLVFNRKGEVFIRKRTEKGLLSGLYEFPWSTERDLFPQTEPQDNRLNVTHVFTHFRLNLKIYTLHCENPDKDGIFTIPDNLKNYPFSTLMKKVYQTYASSHTQLPLFTKVKS